VIRSEPLLLGFDELMHMCTNGTGLVRGGQICDLPKSLQNRNLTTRFGERQRARTGVVSGFRSEWGRKCGPRDEFTPLFSIDVGPYFTLEV
jgi:hypothetical protein